jgi:hypothetical protein
MSKEHFPVFAGKSNVELRMVQGWRRVQLVGRRLKAAYGARPGSGISEPALRLNLKVPRSKAAKRVGAGLQLTFRS